MPQLKAYHRPSSVDEALQLLARTGANTAVIGGGTWIVARMPDLVEEVVDLQAIPNLNRITVQGPQMTLGAMVRLQAIVDDPQAPALLKQAAHREGPNTLRHAATVGGTVVHADKESEFLAALLVFEAEVEIQTVTGIRRMSLDQFLRDVPAALSGGLVTAVSLQTTGQTASDRVARTPADKPIVAALARLKEDGSIRLALCGVANTPVLVDPDNVKAAVSPPSDFRGSGEYRRQMAATLSRRVMNQLSAQ